MSTSWISLKASKTTPCLRRQVQQTRFPQRYFQWALRHKQLRHKMYLIACLNQYSLTAWNTSFFPLGKFSHCWRWGKAVQCEDACSVLFATDFSTTSWMTGEKLVGDSYEQCTGVWPLIYWALRIPWDWEVSPTWNSRWPRPSLDWRATGWSSVAAGSPGSGHQTAAIHGPAWNKGIAESMTPLIRQIECNSV